MHVRQLVDMTLNFHSFWYQLIPYMRLHMDC